MIICTQCRLACVLCTTCQNEIVDSNTHTHAHAQLVSETNLSCCASSDRSVHMAARASLAEHRLCLRCERKKSRI